MKPWLAQYQRHLSAQIRRNTLPHALLFSGVDGAGQEELAIWLIQVVLCCAKNVNNEIIEPCQQCKHCQLFAHQNYPDHKTIAPEKQNLGVDSIRAVSQFFEKTAHIGDAKTALILQAETMTVSAANALLKTLEEPTQNSFIILTTKQRDILLPTIISRCQKIDIRPPSGEALLNSYGTKVHDRFVNLNHLPELSDHNLADEYMSFCKNTYQYLCYYRNRNELLAQLNSHQHAMKWLDKCIVDVIRGQWSWDVKMTTTEDFPSQLTKETLWQIYNVVQVAHKNLHTIVQINKAMLYEKLLADIAFIIRNVEE